MTNNITTTEWNRENKYQETSTCPVKYCGATVTSTIVKGVSTHLTHPCRHFKGIFDGKPLWKKAEAEQWEGQYK